MDISSINPVSATLPPSPVAPPAETAERRQLIQAVKSVNQTGLLGNNQLVFIVDRETRRPIIRVEDRETHEVVLQVPPEYVLRLAQDLRGDSVQISRARADT